jgi:hypothetical protein
MKLPPILQNESVTRLLQGAAGGAVIAMIVGFGWGGWQLNSTAEKTADQRATSAVVAALAPICVDKFQHGADVKAELVALKKIDSWERDSFVKKGGWATFPGSEPNTDVAAACANILSGNK